MTRPRRRPETQDHIAARLRYGRRLLERRVAAQVSLREIAEACGVSLRTVSRWQRGDVEVSALHRDRIGTLLRDRAVAS